MYKVVIRLDGRGKGRDRETEREWDREKGEGECVIQNFCIFYMLLTPYCLRSHVIEYNNLWMVSRDGRTDNPRWHTRMKCLVNAPLNVMLRE